MSDFVPLEGCIVRLRNVQAVDWPSIARLRNAARDAFLDSSEVSVQGVSVWLASMHFPAEGLLRIESPSGIFLGVAGWNHLCLTKREAEIGRLMVDRLAILRQLPRTGSSIAVDAVRAIGRYLFLEYELERVLTSYMASNRYAAKVNRRCGMLPVKTVEHVRPDGSLVKVVHLELTRERWLLLQETYASD